jgi:hypothetical protein
VATKKSVCHFRPKHFICIWTRQNVAQHAATFYLLRLRSLSNVGSDGAASLAVHLGARAILYPLDSSAFIGRRASKPTP